ncbi:MAG: CHAT domain-containing protein [Kouleothrix sp.]|nr:CHAT domain-containing protein [Kouleothrix sp.]
MDRDRLAQQLLTDRSAIPLLLAPLSGAETAALVDQLKAEADRHYWINANRSLELGELIVQIGQTRADLREMALGMMTRGDALKFLGRIEEAWDALGQAGALFQAAGDEVGWARTRIGRVLICADLKRVPEALADAETARAIFVRHAMHEKRVVLDLNTAITLDFLGEHRQALALYQSGLATAESLGAAGERFRGLLLNCMGLTHEALGDLRRALLCHEQARALFAERHETSAAAVAELNIAFIAIAQGFYRRALDLLHRVYQLKIAEQLPLDAVHVQRAMVECYLLLNRYTEARDLARQVIASYQSFGATYKQGMALLHLATAAAHLSDFAGAQAALDSAEAIFASLGASAWIATARLRRSRIALLQGDPALARSEALAAAATFESGGQQVSYAEASLLRGQALLALGDPASAADGAETALRVARRSNVAALRYSAHLLLGQVAEARGQVPRAIQRYRAAAATVERVQRGLTLTLRPGFLEDKQAALRSLIALYLRAGRTGCAFEAIERAKSQVLLGYLSNRERLRWSSDDPRSRELIGELNRLREEHHWFYRLAHERPADEQARPSGFDPQQAIGEVAARERRMRAITEQLYLRSADGSRIAQASPPRLRDVQRCLSERTLLIEYYNDGVNLWAFTLDAAGLQVHALPTTVEAIDRLIDQLQVNLASALSVGPAAPQARGLAGIARRILRRLHAALIEPFEQRMAGRGRLVIVPYGALHYLPFHLLHSGAAYLVEQVELVVLPAASLATRRSPRRPGGALALAHSWGGRLPQTLAEARAVQRRFGGDLRAEWAASREALQSPPGQILHIAAHGEHRLDQPDLSYIQLADGQLYTDDLLQHDLSYELVTLSACETGRANVAAGDEPIGLGRGFLYAGAGALLASLWRIPDDSTHDLMDMIYGALDAGANKAAALRCAQLSILRRQPDLHPAFWGAFQLVGDPAPLSTKMALAVGKEPADGTD